MKIIATLKIQLSNQSQNIEVTPPNHGQVVITFRDGKIVMIEETNKTQIK